MVLETHPFRKIERYTLLVNRYNLSHPFKQVRINKEVKNFWGRAMPHVFNIEGKYRKEFAAYHVQQRRRGLV